MDITTFKGLNNVTDPLRVGLGWLTTADNVVITDTGAIQKRAGYSQVATGSFTGAYATLDQQRLYVVDGGALKYFDGSTFATLKTGLSSAQMYWTEVNDQVFFNNGTDSGIIEPDNAVLDWAWPIPPSPNLIADSGQLPAGQYLVRFTYTSSDGRMTGDSDVVGLNLPDQSSLQITNLVPAPGYTINVFIAPANSTVFQFAGQPRFSTMTWNSQPDALGYDLQTTFLDPLPQGCDVVQHWKGRIYAAQYDDTHDQTAVWFSEPFGFHLFNLNSNFVLILGRVLMMAPTEAGLIIGTRRRIFVYDGEKLEQVADYGVVPGQHWSEDIAEDGSKTVLFWTKRGLCRALPFKNLTERQVSVAPGNRAGGTIVRSGGQKRYVVALQQGGSAYNSYP